MKNQLREDIDSTLPEGWVEFDIAVEMPDWVKPAGSDKGKMEGIPELDWVSILAMASRRERAAKQCEPCSKCYSVQVQLIDWRTDILKYKCRKCKHRFERKLR